MLNKIKKTFKSKKNNIQETKNNKLVSFKVREWLNNIDGKKITVAYIDKKVWCNYIKSLEKEINQNGLDKNKK